MCLLNIRSLKKVNSTNSKACDLLAQDCIHYNVDICVIVETFLKPRIPDTFIYMEGYSIFRRDRKICSCRKSQCEKAHGGGGVLIYVRSSIPCEVYSVSDDCESMWLKMQTHGQNFIFVNASYVPPSANTSYLNCINQYIISESQSIQRAFPKAAVFITGDFNRMCMEDIEISCCTETLHSPPTRLSAHLDLVLTNRSNLVEKVDCFSSRVETDHLAVLVLPLKKMLPDRSVRHFRLFTARGHADLSRSLSDTDFSGICDDNDVHDAAEAQERIIHRLVENSFPLRKVMMSSRDPTWLTPKLKWLLQKKKDARRRGNFRKFERIDNQLKKSKLEKLCQRETKQWWERIDRLTHRKQNTNSIDLRSFDLEELNIQLARRSCMSKGEVRGTAPIFCTTGCEEPQVTLSEVCRILKSCKRTSPGPSRIPHFVFSEHWQILGPLYWHVWNLSLSKGIFPNCYKRAEILPLPKVKNPKCVNQIRAISITSIAARLLERIVHKKWISRNILLRTDPLQFAYKIGLSTIDYLLFFQFFLLSHLDKKTTDGVHAVAVDFSKAFDRVDQELAAEEYPKFIDCPLLQKWLYNFTIERSQRLRLQNFEGTYQNIDRGCSQGTVGGPAIFSMLTNDAVSTRPSCKVLKYSDDMTCLIPCLKCSAEVEKKTMLHEFADFREWAKEKKMVINEEKTKQIRFTLNPTSVHHCVCETIKIESVSQLNLLGITFQRNCLFTKHVEGLIAQCKSLLYLIKDLHLHGASLRDKDKLFNAVILAKIRYGLPVYGCDQRAVEKLDKFLEKCKQRNFTSYSTNIQDLLKKEDKRLLHNIMNNNQHPLRAYLLTHAKQRSTRHNFFGVKPRTNTKLFLNSFCHRVMTI